MNLTLNNKVYDVLKWVVLVLLPAASVLLVALQQAWGWDIPIEAIVTTISAVEVFLGAILGISCLSYKKAAAKEED